MSENVIFNLGGGGSNPLNFKVVGGTTQPNSPRENTIWVNTGTAITDWFFGATQPGTPIEGMVWFSVGTSSSAEFNALKKNGVQVYPLSAKQYVGSAWVSKTAKSYQNGSWVEWVTTVYVYKNGTVLPEAGSVIVVGHASNNGTNISGTSDNQASSAFTFSGKVNIKNCSKLNIKLSQSDIYGSAYFTFGIGTSNDITVIYDAVNNMMVAKKQVTATGTDLVASLDISAYSGQSMYILGNGVSAYSVSEIWLS